MELQLYTRGVDKVFVSQHSSTGDLPGTYSRNTTKKERLQEKEHFGINYTKVSIERTHRQIRHRAGNSFPVFYYQVQYVL